MKAVKSKISYLVPSQVPDICITFVSDKGRKGTIKFWYENGEYTIGECDYEEQDDEDIYDEAWNWFSKHVKISRLKVEVKK